MKDIFTTLKRFVGLFRQRTTLPRTILLPLLVVAVAWPILLMWFDDERATFMVAFVLAMGLRLVLRSDGLIRKVQTRISNRSTVILTLLFPRFINERLDRRVLIQKGIAILILVAGAFLLDLAS